MGERAGIIYDNSRQYASTYLNVPPIIFLVCTSQKWRRFCVSSFSSSLGTCSNTKKSRQDFKTSANDPGITNLDSVRKTFAGQKLPKHDEENRQMTHLRVKTSIVLPLAIVVGLFILPSIAQATAIVGGSLIVQNDGAVTAKFVGSSAGYKSTLYQVGGTLLGNNSPIFSTRPDILNSMAGDTVYLGNYQAGDVLSFRLLVHDTGNEFFSGLGLNNPDGIAHTLVEDLGNGSTQVGWEDLLGGGDRDYNDLIFEFSNTTNEGTPEENPLATPEPSTMILFGSGLLGLGAWRIRIKQG